MRRMFVLAGVVTAGFALPTAASAQAKTDRLNPIIAAQEKGLPVFGISHPAIVRRPMRPGGGPGGAAAAPATPAAPMPEIVLSDVAKETVDYKRADYLFTSGTSDTFLRYMEEITQGGRLGAHASFLGEDRNLARATSA